MASATRERALVQVASCTTSTRGPALGHVLALRPCQEAPDWLRFKFELSLHHVCPSIIKFSPTLHQDCTQQV